MANKKFEVAVSGTVTVWAKDKDEAFDMVHSLCGYEGTDLEIVADGVVDTGETDEN